MCRPPPTGCKNRSPLSSLVERFTSYLYTLSLHDALPIYGPAAALPAAPGPVRLPPVVPAVAGRAAAGAAGGAGRSEEHTSELQSLRHLVCRLLLETKKIVPRHQQWSNDADDCAE